MHIWRTFLMLHWEKSTFQCTLTSKAWSIKPLSPHRMLFYCSFPTLYNAVEMQDGVSSQIQEKEPSFNCKENSSSKHLVMNLISWLIFIRAETFQPDLQPFWWVLLTCGPPAEPPAYWGMCTSAFLLDNGIAFFGEAFSISIMERHISILYNSCPQPWLPRHLVCPCWSQLSLQFSFICVGNRHSSSWIHPSLFSCSLSTASSWWVCMLLWASSGLEYSISKIPTCLMSSLLMWEKVNTFLRKRGTYKASILVYFADNVTTLGYM